MYRLLLAAPLALAVAVPAWADRPGPNWISQAKVRAIIADRGARVVELEADDGHWEGEAVRNGRRFDFHVDPRSGRITKWERDR